MSLTLTPLGVNGLCGSFGRHSMSFLLENNKRQLILLDAGSGVWRLLEPSLCQQLQRYDELIIILSHFHSDHVIGLFSLVETWPGWPNKSIRLCAPAPPLVDLQPNPVLQVLLAPPYFSMQLAQTFTITPFSDSSALSQALGMPVIVRRNTHPGGSVAFRFGNQLAYVTDTIVDQEIIEFALGVDVLLHEVWLTDDEAKEKPEEASRHSHASGVAKIATSAGVKRFMPVHHWPSRDNESLRKLCVSMRSFLGNTKLIYPHERTAIEL